VSLFTHLGDGWYSVKNRLWFCHATICTGCNPRVNFKHSATEIAPDCVGTRTWDTMYGAKTDLMRGRATGRLLCYNPSTNQVTVLACNLYFPNGVAVNKQETMLFFAETFALKLVKFSLEDNMLTTVVSKELTRYPDEVDCSKSLGYAIMPSAIPPLVKWLLIIPYPLEMVVRSLLMALPKEKY
jgi:hypothetical protein